MNDLFYNRDRNITGVETLNSLFTIYPNYGSTVSFSCKNNKVSYNNNTYSMLPSTLNNVNANCSFNFTTNEQQAQKIMNFFESQSGTGSFGIADGSLIYKTLYGYGNGFSISMDANNLYNVSLNFSVERNSSVLNWSGMSFTNYFFEEWSTGKSFLKYQPVYFETQKDNLIKNFFYAKQNHTSALDKAPTNEEFWTQDFFYENDLGVSVDTEPTIEFLNFKNSFPQRIKTQDNIHYFKKLDLTYKNLSDFKLKSMLHFLESHLGYLKFKYTSPKIYNRPKIFYAESWSHTWNYKDSHNLTVSLVEDPLGILNQIDTPDLSLYQSSSRTSFTGSASASDGIYLISTGKKEARENGEFTGDWGSSNQRTIKFYQQLDSVTCTGQDLNKVSFGAKSEIGTGIFSSGNISEVYFNGAKNINYLNFSGNSLTSIDCSNVTGLRYVNLNSNPLTGANFSGCDNLTGVYIRNSTVLSSASLSTILNEVGAGNGISGEIICSGNPSGQSSFMNVSNLDYRGWNQVYTGFSLPLNPDSYANGSTVFYYENIQARQTGESYFLKWFSSKAPNTLVQAYTPNSPNWFYPIQSQIDQRAAYNFNQTYLTGTGINHDGERLAIYTVLSISDAGYGCVMNFSDSRKYGLFCSGANLYFLNDSESYLIGQNLNLNTYYSFGFVRNPTHFTGIVDGAVSNTGIIGASALTEIKPSVGASYLQDDFFAGKIAEILIYSSTSSSITNTGELNQLFNSKFGIIV